MKYGELKIECINEMDEIDDVINMQNLSTFEDSANYLDLFQKMPGSINRAMDRIANRKKLPTKQAVLNLLEHNEIDNYLVFNLSLISNFRSIKNVSVLINNKINYIDTLLDNNTLYVNSIYKNGIITLSYYPKSPAVNSLTQNTDELDLPDELARLIPYYVKSDLIERQEPELAAASRNKFESALDEISLNEEDSFTKTIQKDYRI